jgi:hypothetical protein
MTKSDVGYLSALRRLYVGQLVGPLGVLLLAATGAHASAWEEFETRCLVPMENAKVLVTEGLVEMQDAAPEPGTKFIGQELPQGNYFVLVALDEGQTIGCGFAATADAEQSFENYWLAWKKQALASERYVVGEATGFLKLPFLESTFREPRMQVSFLKGKNDAGEMQSMIIAGETDLES